MTRFSFTGERVDNEHCSPPQFVKILHDETVTEGDSVTIQCTNPHDDDHGMKARAPQFTQSLEDHEVCNLKLVVPARLDSTVHILEKLMIAFTIAWSIT